VIRSSAFFSFVLIAFVMASAGCSSSSDWQSIARTNEYVAELVPGDSFQHRVFLHRVEQAGDVLHIYIEGDGVPWVTPRRVSRDPTPRHALMLELMSLDSGPAAYIGRPCYFDTLNDADCNPVLWTDQRYSEPVVQSLCAATRYVGRQRHVNRFRLFGHSGGGALAVLMARCLDNLDAVVTLGANLDTEAWTRLHGYTPLYGSLNPATAGLQTSRPIELHIYGTEDRVAPRSAAEQYLLAATQARTISVSGAGHADCWRALWPQILSWTEAVVTGDHTGDPEWRCESK